jgi:TIR domain
LLRFWQRGMFHKVQLMHNPILLFGPDKGTCFISYAWRGHPDLAEHEHRAWTYRLADALALAGYRPVIDFNFLAPALVSREVIESKLIAANHVLIVYSDEYIRRRARPQTGVGFEWHLLSSDPALWSKTIPIRRNLTDEEAALFAAETRFVMSFEEGDLTANTSILAHEISKRGAR